MKTILTPIALLALLACALFAQPAVYTVSDSGTLSGSTALTIQHTASSIKTVSVCGVYVRCFCTITLYRSGTAATATGVSPKSQSSISPDTEAQGFSSSDVGAGITLGAPYQITGIVVIPVSTVLARGKADNFTVALSNGSGTYDYMIQYEEK